MTWKDLIAGMIMGLLILSFVMVGFGIWHNWAVILALAGGFVYMLFTK